VKGKVRRDVRTAARALAASALAAAAALAAGCNGSTPRDAAAPAGAPAARAAAATPEQQGEEAEARDLRDAQRAWCSYLQALYLRADDTATSWPRYQQCAEATTMASPAMLRETADCSLLALQRFQGDPFTAEYAAEVSRCGVEAIEHATMSEADLAPFVTAICGRISSCEHIDPAECRQRLEAGLAPHLMRAIGSMNRRGRAQLRGCLSAVPCQDISEQISACIEPIMDDLLWLPS